MWSLKVFVNSLCRACGRNHMDLDGDFELDLVLSDHCRTGKYHHLTGQFIETSHFPLGVERPSFSSVAGNKSQVPSHGGSGQSNDQNKDLEPTSE
jgi:hypothetical protein